MSAAPKEGWTTAQTMAALRERYPVPAYAFFAEVRDATGAADSRAADALVMSCWPSRGLTLTGFEVKCARADWLKELKTPEKAEAICRFCDYWYVVAGSRGIVQPGELPPTWGLMEPKGGKLVITREAPKLEPVPVSRLFLASLLRRTVEASADTKAIEEAAKRARAQGFEEGRKREAECMSTEIKIKMADYERLRGALKEFEEASGIRIDGWTGGKRIGDAAHFVMSGGMQEATAQMRAARRSAEAVIKTCDSYQELLKESKDEEVPGSVSDVRLVPGYAQRRRRSDHASAPPERGRPVADAETHPDSVQSGDGRDSEEPERFRLG